MNTADSIALSSSIATWAYVIEMFIYLVLVYMTLDIIKEQVDYQAKGYKFQEVVTILTELRTSDFSNARKYIYYEDLPENTAGVSEGNIIAHLQKTDEVFITFDRIGYLIYEKYISVGPVIESYWQLIWICWKKSEGLINWVRQQIGQINSLDKFKLLFYYAEAYRNYKDYPEPKLYRVTKILLK